MARYRARMEVVDKWMAKRHLPLKLRSRIGHYYAEVRSRQTRPATHKPVHDLCSALQCVCEQALSTHHPSKDIVTLAETCKHVLYRHG